MSRRSTGRVVVVIGASSGIGRATAVALAAQGDTLVLASRSAEALADVERECRDAAPRPRRRDRSGPPAVSVVPTDVSLRPSVERLFDVTLARHGRIDAIVHAPAVVAYGHFEDVPAEVFDQVITTNLLGAANVARLALPLFKASGAGHLVLVGSLLGKIATPFMSSYVTSKWGLHGLARTLQAEVRWVKGVDVSLVFPGGVDTPIYSQAASYARREGRPPIPVDPPEAMARAIAKVLDRPRRETSVGLANGLYTAGFRLLPGVFDVLVTPLMSRAGMSMTRSPEDHTGNVFAPVPRGEDTYGKWGRHWMRGVVAVGAGAVAVGAIAAAGALTADGERTPKPDRPPRTRAARSAGSAGSVDSVRSARIGAWTPCRPRDAAPSSSARGSVGSRARSRCSGAGGLSRSSSVRPT
ncbi:SDR family NAD(P)-dependent oxidoreductase [Cellulomonas sp. ATA003]|uniref:SDR family NAD(P)-dependent oxidoreductase n=1 Tax=Cellulomonas sp. ATA003 TaxID=3073064 RepID=UPI00287382D5|nr:SDR family NAD(P)-dependent oxidoreductase [Cellulomonas sp. ATA003]WNB85653.1 SDR family NAD(P)-dependent oxidoreductase [Cellulomonas sp. ATA003]